MNKFFLNLIAGGIALALMPMFASAKDQLRPAVGEPLQAAQALMQKGQPSAALAQIRRAASVGKLTAYEGFIVTQMRGAALSAAGQPLAAASEFEKVLANGRLPAAEALNIREALVGTYLHAKQYRKSVQAIQAYQQAGGAKSAVLGYLPQAYYHAGDYRKAATESARQISKLEKAGQRPPESQLQLLASSYAKLGDMQGYSKALERMVRYHPKPKYWADVIQRTASKPGFSRKLDLDMLRLLRVTQNLKTEAEYMEMAQLALQVNLAAEAQSIIEEGLERKLLGQGDARANERLGRLRKLIAERIAEDEQTMAAADQAVTQAANGDPMVRQGLAYVTYGQSDKGLKLIGQGIAKGELKAAAHAQLHLGYAYYLAGDKAKASRAFAKVDGQDGARDFARLWRIFLTQT